MYEYKTVEISGDLHFVADHMNQVEAKQGWHIAGLEPGYPDSDYTTILLERKMPDVPKIDQPDRLKGCKSCHGSGGKKIAPCKICHGSGKITQKMYADMGWV